MNAHRALQYVMAAVLALAAMPAGAIVVKEEGDTEVSVSGFMDVVFTSHTPDEELPLLAINQAELTVGAIVAPRIAISITPAWDGEAMSLATAYVQLDKHSTDEQYFSRHLSGMGLLVGRFDVPFGLDWLSYPSIDRPLITPPEAVLGTHGAWNADGVAVLGRRGMINGILHATGGFDFEGETADGTQEQWLARHAEGGRLGLTPLTGFSLGMSGAIITAAHERDMYLVGLDAMVRTGRLDMRGEIIRHRAEADGLAITDEGWYLQAKWDLGPAYAIARWDVLLDDGEEDSRHLSMGVGVPLNPWVTLRSEYQMAVADKGEDTFYLQMAAGF